MGAGFDTGLSKKSLWVLTAPAHKLAWLIDAMPDPGRESTSQGRDGFEERYRQRVVASVVRRAQQLGLKQVPEMQTA